MINKKKSLFDITFDPKMQPGHQTRYGNFQGLIGKQMHEMDDYEKSMGIFRDQYSREKFRSRLVPEITPSVILRKKGAVR